MWNRWIYKEKVINIVWFHNKISICKKTRFHEYINYCEIYKEKKRKRIYNNIIHTVGFGLFFSSTPYINTLPFLECACKSKYKITSRDVCKLFIKLFA